MTAPNYDALAVAAAQSIRDQGTEAKPDCAAIDVRMDKLRATWPALAALAGYELRRLADGRWLVSRWNLSRELDETDVPGFLQQVGAL